ncbi:MAG TPA: tetratricopeptide repeat protein [Terracidiphilus sp.]|jgi:TolA-binding protein
MLKSSHFSRRLLTVAAVFLLAIPASTPAHAVSKEMVELQTQVQQLLDAVQRLQSTMDARLGVLEHLAQQTADQANQVGTTVTALQQKINAQNEAVSTKVDSVSGQVQSLNDSVDELKARIAKLDKSVQDLQTQLQAMQAAQAPQQPGATGSGPGGTAPGGPDQGPGMPSASQPGGTGAQQAPPLQETLQAGVRDYTAGHYQVAQGEFQDVVHYYPLDDASGTAQFYLGEIAYQQKDYPAAINDYNAVLEGFSGNAKASAAQLHKAFALIATEKREEGIHELRSLIQRHPQTPEARAARTKLTSMGVKTEATR